jgi:hypothetical protein
VTITDCGISLQEYSFKFERFTFQSLIHDVLRVAAAGGEGGGGEGVGGYVAINRRSKPTRVRRRRGEAPQEIFVDWMQRGHRVEVMHNTLQKGVLIKVQW